MYNTVDARGRACPEPVVMTKQAIENYDGKAIQVLVDAMVAVENIKRFVKNQGFQVNVEENNDEYILLIRK